MWRAAMVALPSFGLEPHGLGARGVYCLTPLCAISRPVPDRNLSATPGSRSGLGVRCENPGRVSTSGRRTCRMAMSVVEGLSPAGSACLAGARPGSVPGWTGV
jgi:hypothetical protein